MEHKPGKNSLTSIHSRQKGRWGDINVKIDLKPEIVQKTGYTKAMASLWEEAADSPQRQCKEPECKEMAASLQLRIMSVLDAEGDEVDINTLAPGIAELIREAHQYVEICFTHLLEAVAKTPDISANDNDD